MNHTSWSNKEGAPRDVVGLAQEPDGILWIASNHGLFTFDGFGFNIVTIPNDVSGGVQKTLWQLLVAHDGSVWFAFHSGGAVHLQNGRMAVFAKIHDGQDVQNIGSLQQDSHGTLWCVFNDQHPAFLAPDGTWHTIALPLEDGAHIQEFLLDSNDTRWVIQHNRVYRQGVADPAFVPVSLQIGGPALIKQAPDHTVWIAGPQASTNSGAKPATMMHHIDASGHVLQSIYVSGEVGRFLVDRNGSVWISIVGKGLLKLRINPHRRKLPLPVGQTYSRQDGLTSNENIALFEDSHGNIWTGGSRGLDRFAPATLVPALRSQASGLWSTCIDPDGAVLAGGRYAALYRLRNGQGERISGVLQLDALYCNGRSVWLLDGHGAAKIEGSNLLRLPFLPKHSGFWDDYIFTSICELGPRKLLAWASGAQEDDLWVYEDKQWRRIAGADRFGRVLSIVMDQGRIFFGRRDGKIDVVQGEDLDNLLVANSGIDSVIGFAPTSLGLAAFGRRGIALEKDNGFRPIPFTDGLVTTHVTGLVQAKNGDLWVNSDAGITRVRLDEINKALQDSHYKVVGYPIARAAESAPPSMTISGGSAHMDRQGRLWFGSNDVVVSVDPDNLPTAPTPQIKLVSISGDGQFLESDHTLRPGIRTLRAQYLGVQLSDPDSVTYRYRLVGYDEKWQEVGSRREAVYTNLKPGTYRFEVMAKSPSGAWTDPLQTEPFRIRPYFWQTWWFLIVTVGIGLWCLRLFYEQRLRTIKQQARMLAEERAEERTRIARELHDTLLQGIQGLLLNFEVVRHKLAQGGEVMELLDRSLSATEALVVEGRERIAIIRQENSRPDALHRRLKGLTLTLSGERGVEIHLKIFGTVRTMNANVSEELYFIAREAIRNALQHSNASQVQVELYFSERLFRMECRDNGQGFDVSKELLQSDLRTKWGLQGMRERADSIRAQLRMTSTVSAGTVIEVRVDSKYAYADHKGSGWFFST